MTAVLASPTAPPERSRPPMRTPIDGSGPFATFWEVSSAPPVVERAAAEASPAREPAIAGGPVVAADAIAEFTRAFTRLLLTQWMAAFFTYEVLAAAVDRKGRYLPTLGL